MTAPTGEGQQPLQFDAAEPAAATAAPAAGVTCANCQRAITTTYHLLNEAVLCGPCRGKLERELNGSGAGGRMGSAILWGVGGGIVGSIAYYAVAAISGYIIGIVAILVGWLVGKGVNRGSGGRGGVAYQVVAMVITWFAIASAYIPMAISEAREQGALSAGEGSSVDGGPAVEDAEDAFPKPVAQKEVAGADSLAVAGPVTTGGAVMGIVILLGLIAAIPIIGNGPIGWLIVAIGLYEAWKLNKRVPIAFTGPFKVGAAPA